MDRKDIMEPEEFSEEYSPQPEETSPPEEPKPPKKNHSLLLTILQTTAALLILGAAMTVKLIGGTVYSVSATWFYEHYNNSVFPDTENSLFAFIDGVSVRETSLITPEAALESGLSPQLQQQLICPVKGGTPLSSDNTGESGENSGGIDLAASANAPVYAALSGKVQKTGEDPSGGKYILLSHEDELSTFYGNCRELKVKEGASVKAGEQIAVVGTQGQGGKGCLHFEITMAGRKIDPLPLLKPEKPSA